MDRRKAIVDWCVKSLSEEPQAWDCDHYTCSHKATGVTVWIANGHYGLSIFASPKRDRDEEIGGVTGWSSFFGSVIPWRRRVYAAAKFAARNGMVDAEDAIITSIQSGAA